MNIIQYYSLLFICVLGLELHLHERMCVPYTAGDLREDPGEEVLASSVRGRAQADDPGSRGAHRGERPVFQQVAGLSGRGPSRAAS